jgi:hypothetical protein
MINIRMTVAGQTISAQLADTPTARHLAGQLPLRLRIRDYNGVEKVAELPQPLTTEGAPAGDDPDIDDIAYYHPLRNLVFYYGEVGYWPGIVRIGRLTNQDTQLIQRQPDDSEITIDQC